MRKWRPSFKLGVVDRQQDRPLEQDLFVVKRRRYHWCSVD